MMELVRLSVEGKVAFLELVAEFNRNALSPDMEAAILASLEEARGRGAAVAVLRSAHGTFCSGYNVGTTGRADYVADKDIFSDCERLQRHIEFLTRLREYPLPLIAEVAGHCLAGGTDLMLSTDIAIAADEARIGLPNVRGLGISLLACIWPWMVGPMRAKMMMFTGDVITGHQAEHWGLVAMAVPAPTLQQTVRDMAFRIALTPPAMLAVTKRASNRAFDVMGLQQLMRAGVELDAMAHFTQPVIDFWEKARTDGIKSALKERDAAFAGEGLSELLRQAALMRSSGESAGGV